MPSFKVQYNADATIAALDQLGQRSAAAITRALKRTGTSVQVVMARAVAEDMGLPVGVVRQKVSLRVSAADQVATISVSGARIPLIDFKATGQEPSRGRGRGVSARLGGARTRYPNAFIATMRSGHRGVFTRVGQSSRRSAGGRSNNLPIAELMGPSLPHVFTKHIPLGIERAQEQLAKNLEHELQFALSKE